MSLSQEIDSLLPQTQCGLCGYAGCRPYAEAMAAGHASIDRCPPGGIKTLRALATLLAVDPNPYVATHVTRPPARALIREAECIGCTKCIQACPVDAIVGARKFMHSIVTKECTGCGLCIEPCPVDCIDLQDLEGENSYDPNLARARHSAKEARIAQDKESKVRHYQTKASLVTARNGQAADKAAKQAYVLAALARAGKN